ncbi:hypothetical protein DID88_007261 [Monilinia fructigena]|uniref:Uncharacterized protein n=1 Tax=Monilinia fructigena TaxID=38457 RepID=A0A395J8U2_9HELO|nr:hypothetical protein DID88_007261 [Monilinia fructigena]
MSSTPMVIDSPLGANGNSILKNGVSTVPSTAKLTEMISLYTPVKLFRHSPTPLDKGQTPPSIISYNLSISMINGSQLITSETDNTMQIYDVLDGRTLQDEYSAKYGCNHAMFGHAEHCIIHSSTKKDHKNVISLPMIILHPLFRGTMNKMSHGLSLHPGQDNFISCSEDNTLRIWDAASNNPAFLRRDRGGARRLGAGDHNPDNLDPSSSDYLPHHCWRLLLYSDGRYVISGSRGKNVLVWDTLAATANRVLNPLHELEYAGESAIVAFNPKYNHFATADQEVLFWVPNTDML